jgi:hypothetical protein
MLNKNGRKLLSRFPDRTASIRQALDVMGVSVADLCRLCLPYVFSQNNLALKLKDLVGWNSEPDEISIVENAIENHRKSQLDKLINMSPKDI